MGHFFFLSSTTIFFLMLNIFLPFQLNCNPIKELLLFSLTLTKFLSKDLSFDNGHLLQCYQPGRGNPHPYVYWHSTSQPLGILQTMCPKSVHKNWALFAQVSHHPNCKLKKEMVQMIADILCLELIILYIHIYKTLKSVPSHRRGGGVAIKNSKKYD